MGVQFCSAWGCRMIKQLDKQLFDEKARSSVWSTQKGVYDFLGHHLMASYIDCDSVALNNQVALVATMEKAVKESGATLLNSAKHVFPSGGLTMVLLLAESHASIHTYPEHKACFVDLFTCGESCSTEKFDAVLTAYLCPKVAHR